VLGIKLKAGWLVIIAMLLLSAFWATLANAEGGPYFYHRAIGSTVKGVKISESSPEPVEGKGEEQKLSGKIGGQETEVVSSAVEIKGEDYNTVNSAQSKLKLVYIEPKLKKPNLPGCEVKVGPENTVHLELWQIWKWDGTPRQLKKQFVQWKLQKWDGWAIVRQPHFTKEQEESQEIEPPNETFTEIALGKGCGLLENTKSKTNGTASIQDLLKLPGEYTQTQSFVSEGAGTFKQHICFWWRPECTGFKLVALELAGSTAEYKGSFKATTPNQELALYTE
jgi:hypothetical protein